MTDTTISADIISLRKRPLSDAERAKAYRERKRLGMQRVRDRKKARKAAEAAAAIAAPVTPTVTPALVAELETLPVTPATSPVTPSRSSHAAIAPWLLTGAAIGLALVGVTMNAWYAKSLGSTEISGWLFLGVGVAADAVALATPSCAARLWSTHQRGAAAAGWLVWLLTFLFALTAGIGFASVNISDVSQARASRTTPAVTTAQAALGDAQASRDRECRDGVGKICRQREDAVTTARAALETAMRSVELQADPQVEAATKMVTWLSAGTLRPSSDDFAMLRLVLVAMLPQLGGIVMMVARSR